MSATVLSLLSNIGQLALAVMLLFILRNKFNIRDKGFRQKFLMGVVFGVCSVLVVHYPIEGPLGAKFDTRSAPIVIATIYGGFIPGAIAGSIGAIARYEVGGPAALGGMASFFFYVCSGMAYRYVYGTKLPDLTLLTGVALFSTVAVIPSFFIGQEISTGITILSQFWHVLLIGNLTGIILLGLMTKQFRSFLVASKNMAIANKNLDKLRNDLTIKLKAAENINQIKDRFLAHTSHELRTPLNAIIGFSQMIQSIGIKNLTDELLLEYLEDIEISGQNLLSIVNDLLDLKRIENNNQQLNIGQFKPIDIINEAISGIQVQATNEDIKLEVGEVTEISVLCDKKAMYQCLLNLLTNAIKYSPRSSQITISAKCDHRMVSFEVQDQGIGISNEVLQNIGQPFLRGDSPFIRNVEGTGLGLAITKSFVDKQNGQFLIKRNDLMGSTAFIKMPIARQSNNLLYQSDLELKTSVA